ncbi:hypothetical protein K491DRAFT_721201 [Lophiostoma macrostomum CBS 122681]|uniref:PKD domain-containing protein n=1 Tax=Lophiostoma macrostomum CBS 122681 TaxID=1314788 RepID=A0A6A6STP0_9PLEO|nr:hypothetical protein K491DRAFT_721201 [Lophiostoma macrostomum CBS 122681]
MNQPISTYKWMQSAIFLLILPLASLQSPTPAAECITLGTSGPMQITSDCIDPTYNFPIVDSETDEDSPIQHRKVSGHFNGTGIDFNIYMPEKARWGGKFFQLSYPTQNATADPETVAFAADSSAYAIQATGALGYRADAALAKFSRGVARVYYQQDPSLRIYGYLYGGSGGSFTTIGAMENTFGVWDSAVALIQAPLSANLTIGPSALWVDFPGGTGDPLTSLNETGRAVLEEVTALGLQLKVWEDFEGVGQNRSNPSGTGLADIIRLLAVPQIRGVDPTYSDDFWSQPGYLGTEKSPLGDIFRNALVEFNTTVQQVETDSEGTPIEIILDDTPPFIITKGPEFTIITERGKIGQFTGILDAGTNRASIQPGSNTTVLAAMAKGTQIQIDNRWNLAIRGYHRHQVPTDRSFYAYDYLRYSNGEPRYPQREVMLAPIISRATSGGGTHTGNITAKLIVMDNMLDYDAFPWHADWYKSKVQQALGDRFSDNYRLHFSDNADHSMYTLPQAQTARLIDFRGLYEQYLRDLSAWVEKAVTPPDGTKYSVDNGQVVLPLTAASRRSIQPIVDLTFGGESHIQVSVGQNVTFTVHAEVPPATGAIVSLEWDFYGVGDYVQQHAIQVGPVVDVEVTHIYDATGFYLPSVRVASQRTGDQDTSFARVLNIGRARVTVK